VPDEPVCSVRHHQMPDGDEHFASLGVNGEHWWIPGRFRFVGRDVPKQLRTWWGWLLGRPQTWEVTFRFVSTHDVN
jgi:hypothetical protein